jgi:hypothetical protein
MGNRAVISLGKRRSSENVAIYLHWNGGRASIEGFLLATKAIMAGREGDGLYATARLVETIGSFFEGNTSVGVGLQSSLDCDNGDNGMYLVDPESLEIIGRYYCEGYREEIDLAKTNIIAARLIRAKLERTPKDSYYDRYRATLERSIKELEGSDNV